MDNHKPKPSRKPLLILALIFAPLILCCSCCFIMWLLGSYSPTEIKLLNSDSASWNANNPTEILKFSCEFVATISINGKEYDSTAASDICSKGYPIELKDGANPVTVKVKNYSGNSEKTLEFSVNFDKKAYEDRLAKEEEQRKKDQAAAEEKRKQEQAAKDKEAADKKAKEEADAKAKAEAEAKTFDSMITPLAQSYCNNRKSDTRKYPRFSMAADKKSWNVTFDNSVAGRSLKIDHCKNTMTVLYYVQKNAEQGFLDFRSDAEIEAAVKKSLQEIADKKYWIGMQRLSMVGSLGTPDDINTTVTSGTEFKQYVYCRSSYCIDSFYIYSDGDKVTSWQD